MFKKNKFVKLTSGLVLSASVPTLTSFATGEEKNEVDLLMILKIAGLCLTGIGFIAYIATLFNRKGKLEELNKAVSNEEKKKSLQKEIDEKGALKRDLQSQQIKNSKEIKDIQGKTESIRQEREEAIESKVLNFERDEILRTREDTFKEKIKKEKEQFEQVKNFFENRLKQQVDGLEKIKEKIYKIKELKSKEGNGIEIDKLRKEGNGIEIDKLRKEIKGIGESFCNFVLNDCCWLHKAFFGKNSEDCMVDKFLVDLRSFEDRTGTKDAYFTGILINLSSVVSLASWLDENTGDMKRFEELLSTLKEYCERENKFLKSRLAECEAYNSGVKEDYIKKRVENFKEEEIIAQKTPKELEADRLLEENEGIVEQTKKLDKEIKKCEKDLESLNKTLNLEHFEYKKRQLDNLNKNKNFYKPWFLSENFD